MIEQKIGDKVWVDGYTSIAQQNQSSEEIKKVKFKYNEDTGKKYQICKVGNSWCNSIDGAACNDNSMYYIEFQ